MIDFAKKNVRLIAKICTVVTVILFSIILMVTIITVENAGAISSFLGSQTFITIQPEESEDEDTDYYKSSYTSVADLLKDGGELAEKIMAEGAVLLKNENNALPLKNDERNVSVFGASCVNPAYGGAGSSSAANPAPPVTMDEGLKQAGIAVNDKLWKFYDDNKDNYKVNKDFINEAPWSAVTADPAVTQSFTTYGDAAVVILRRIRGEASDLVVSDTSKTDAEDGNFLKLSPNERGMLEELNKLKGKTGGFDRIVILLNSPNPMEGAFLNDPTLGIDAALWIGAVGRTGFNAVGDILTGAVNPSGRLSETYFTEHRYNPTMANFGASQYTNYSEFASQIPSEGMPEAGMGTILGMFYSRYVVYQEGIYVGYRYTETRYEDAVMKTADVGDFKYSDVVSYPFGYGQSYTKFKYSDFKVDKKGGDYVVSVTVTNDGESKGKETVQLYLQKPYTEYDRQNDIEKAAVELVGYGKTKELEPGHADVVQVTVDGRDFASYDVSGAGTYVIAGGKHYLTVGKDAHDATNNILAAKGFSAGMDAAGDAALTKSLDLAFDNKTYSISANEKKIGNLFDFADMNRYENKGANKVTYASRKNWSGTLPTLPIDYSNANAVKLAMTQGLVDDLLAQGDVTTIEKDDAVAYPQYDVDAGLMLVDMRVDSDGNAIPYGDPAWETFLNQLTWDETAYLVSTGLRKTGFVESITKPETKDHNGPTGLTQPFGENKHGLAAKNNDPDKGLSPTYYPAINVLASTFSHEIALEYGNMLGEESLWAGYNGFYGIGMNNHRTAYDGRVFEYYSEDPHLTGAAATDVVIAIQKHGCYAYIKHLAGHEQQDCRIGLSIWSNEQAYREIYLRPFEWTIVKGDAHAAMASFSRAGALNATADSALLNGFVRNECGFDGFIVSDMWQIGYKNENMPIYLMNGLDLPDGDIDTAKPYNAFKPGSGYGNVAQAMRESAHRILYTVANSNAMNSYSSKTRIVKVMPEWMVAEVVLLVVFGVLMLASVALAVACFVTSERKKSIV